MTRRLLFVLSVGLCATLYAGISSAQNSSSGTMGTGNGGATSTSGTDTSGSGNDGGTNAGTNPPVTSSPTKAVRTSSSATTAYVHKTQMSDEFEIESSKLALSRSANVKVKDFAKKMITDHGESSSKLTKVLLHDQMTAGTKGKLDSAHAADLANLKSSKGKAFDSAYLKMQNQGHQDALALQQQYAASGDNADLKAFAASAVTMIQGHIQMLHDIGSASGS